jgi:cytochrome c551/c552
MYSWPNYLPHFLRSPVRAAMFAILFVFSATSQAENIFPGIGRTATPQEIAAWNIDVRPDFAGLPVGQGSVNEGMVVWEAKCAGCHGVFGESNQSFSPLVGGTTAQDIETGHVQRLTDPAYPGRTTLMKVASLSTLWDYINRAMPWTNPKSLSANEVYAVVAYLLNLGGVVPDNFVLSKSSMAQAQNRLPNRNGMTTDHGLWPGKGMGNGGRADVAAKACMKDCVAGVTIRSSLPDFARNAHGNLAEQNRQVGAQRGADTSRPAPNSLQQAQQQYAQATPPSSIPVKEALGAALASSHGCVACHAVDAQVLGPAFRAIAKKHADRTDLVPYLEGKIRSGGSGVWGSIPMPAQSLKDDDARAIAEWIATGAKP